MENFWGRYLQTEAPKLYERLIQEDYDWFKQADKNSLVAAFVYLYIEEDQIRVTINDLNDVVDWSCKDTTVRKKRLQELAEDGFIVIEPIGRMNTYRLSNEVTPWTADQHMSSPAATIAVHREQTKEGQQEMSQTEEIIETVASPVVSVLQRNQSTLYSLPAAALGILSGAVGRLPEPTPETLRSYQQRWGIRGAILLSGTMSLLMVNHIVTFILAVACLLLGLWYISATSAVRTVRLLQSLRREFPHPLHLGE